MLSYSPIPNPQAVSAQVLAPAAEASSSSSSFSPTSISPPKAVSFTPPSQHASHPSHPSISAVQQRLRPSRSRSHIISPSNTTSLPIAQRPSIAGGPTATNNSSIKSTMGGPTEAPVVHVTGLTSDLEKLQLSKLAASAALAETNGNTTRPPADTPSAPPSIAPSSSSASVPPPASSPPSHAPQRYAAERIIGNGSFGVVYQATNLDTNEVVAIKKVLQDPKFKNRELQILGMLDHPNCIRLRHCFYSRGDTAEQLYLNLVMDYIPETVYRCLRTYYKASKLLPLPLIKCYLFQIVRSVAYIHALNISHRDIKPQNLLLHSRLHHVLLCDMGSAKQLIAGEPNVSYICSRYYRAPELVFEATQYSTAIDLWSIGCVMGEMLAGSPLFPGESAVDQLIEIIKVLGTPTREEIFAMNPSHTKFKFPQIKPHPWAKIFKNRAPAQAIDLLSNWLCYEPNKRLSAMQSLTHPFFDDLKAQTFQMPGDAPMPQHLFDFTTAEITLMQQQGLAHKIVPRHLYARFGLSEFKSSSLN